jgi:hypothetical protein
VKSLAMSAESTAWPPPVIESFELEKDPVLSAAEAAPGFPRPLARVIVRGRNFFIRAVSPTITIGDRKVLDSEILPDEKTILLYLFEPPPQGGKIRVSYGPGMTGESEQSLFWDAEA